MTTDRVTWLHNLEVSMKLNFRSNVKKAESDYQESLAFIVITPDYITIAGSALLVFECHDF